jgi:hypothetical protein
MPKPSRANAGANRDRPRQLPTSGPVLRAELARSSPSFQVVAIDGGEDMLARDYRTLTLAAGDGVTLTTDKPAGVVTITAEGGVGSVAAAQVTITAPYSSREWSETVDAPGATAESKVFATWGLHEETDVNNPDADGLRIRAAPKSDSITFTVYGNQPFGGPLRINYLLG